MPTLDLHTIVFLTGVMGALLALVLDYMRRSYPVSIQGLSEWSAGPVFFFLAALLLNVHDQLPAWQSLLITNLLLFAGTSLMLAGSRRFFGYAMPQGWLPALLALCSWPLLWLSWWSPNYNALLIFVTGLLGALVTAHAWLVWRHDRRTYAGRFTLATLVTLALSVWVRLASALIEPAGNELLNPSPAQSAYIGIFSFGILLLTVGLMLQASERLREELERMVTHDTLTGALSRRALFEQGVIEIARSRRSGVPLSILMLDLDHFKHVNDHYGHMIGDQVLQDFVQRIQGLLRRQDMLGRFGGEEFVVLLSETRAGQVANVAQRILGSETAAAGLPRCTVSIGAATLAQDETLEALINRADTALYRAKEGGRNRVEFAPLA